jgi:TRAP-type uncharacterized transport system substrate-binding protein
MTGFKLGTLFASAAALLLSAGIAQAQPKSLTLGTASVGGTYFIYGGVVARVRIRTSSWSMAVTSSSA